MSDLKITGLRKSYGRLEVLKGIDLDIKSGEFIVFVGPSGCGKSTLLRAISGLEDISAGKLEIGGTDMTRTTPSKRGIAMVFQSYALYPHMTVAQNISFGLEMAKMPKDEIAAAVADVAKTLQLEDYIDSLPKNLSGGQRQRVAIGRAIVRNPDVFLFDEPLSNLDASLRVQMRIYIAKLNGELPDTTFIYVTHDQVEAMTMADRIVVLNDGCIEQVGTPMELYNQPANLFVAGFIGSPKMNFLKGDIAKKAGATTIGIRPEHLTVSKTKNAKTSEQWSGVVNFYENLGSDTFFHLDVGGGNTMIARGPEGFIAKIGDTVHLTPKKGKTHLFDSHGKPTK